MILEGGGALARLQSVGEDTAVMSLVEGDDAPTMLLPEVVCCKFMSSCWKNVWI